MTRKLTIESKTITDDSDCWVIAEIGHNHQGSVEKCKELFKAAAQSGADAVKLQKRDNRNLFTKAFFNKPYESEASFGATYGEHREKLELGGAEYRELQAYAKELGVTMFATPFDIASADFLAELDMPVYKIASADLRNTPLLAHVARLGKPMIVSTGGGTLEDVKRAYDTIMPINSQLAILQCTASYPTPPEELNLNVIRTLRDTFPDVTVGLSDHYNGIAMSVAAYVLGGRIVEKHFTMNHTWKGTDHPLSLEPPGMTKMVRDLRRLRVALGDGVKRTLPSEVAPITKMGKKLVAARSLPQGHKLTRADIAVKSPGDGLQPYEIDRLVGRTITAPLAEDENLTFELLARE